MDMRIAVSILMLSLLAAAPATQPSLEVRAATAFTNGQYALALPMLQKLQVAYEGNPDKLGPIAEQIKVCQTQIAQAQAVNGVADPTTPVVSSNEQRKKHAPPQPNEVR